MAKKGILVIVTLIFSFCSIGLSLAQDKAANARRGKALFRQNCRACHSGDKAQELGPYQKKIKEWEAVFAKDKYKEYKCRSEWEKLSEQDLLDMLKYLRDGAADSKVPRGCG